MRPPRALKPEIPGHSSSQQWGSTRPRTWPHSPAGRHQAQDPRSPITFHVRTQPTPAGWRQLRDTLGPLSQPLQDLVLTHQRVSTSFGTPWNPHAAMWVGGSSPTHQQADSKSGNPSPTTSNPRTWLHWPVVLRPPRTLQRAPHGLVLFTNTYQPLHKAGPGSRQAQGPAASYHSFHSTQLPATEGPTQSTEGAPLKHTALVTRRDWAAAMKGEFSKVRKCNQYTEYTGEKKKNTAN